MTPTKQQIQVIAQIAKRAVKMATEAGIKYTQMDALMDLDACISNGCPLKLDELLAADDGNFGHDVFGIRRHINRETGQLENCFLPRFAQPEAVAASNQSQVPSGAREKTGGIMDDKVTISTFQLFKMFPDNEAARNAKGTK